MSWKTLRQDRPKWQPLVSLQSSPSALPGLEFNGQSFLVLYVLVAFVVRTSEGGCHPEGRFRNEYLLRGSYLRRTLKPPAFSTPRTISHLSFAARRVSTCVAQLSPAWQRLSETTKTAASLRCPILPAVCAQRRRKVDASRRHELAEVVRVSWAQLAEQPQRGPHLDSERGRENLTVLVQLKEKHVYRQTDFKDEPILL